MVPSALPAAVLAIGTVLSPVMAEPCVSPDHFIRTELPKEYFLHAERTYMPTVMPVNWFVDSYQRLEVAEDSFLRSETETTPIPYCL